MQNDTLLKHSKHKTLVLILAASAACVAGAVFALRRDPMSMIVAAGVPFLPTLAEKAASIDRAEIERGGKSLVLVRAGGDTDEWTLESRDGYPARLEELKAIVSGLAGMRIDQRMTALPERHGELGLSWPDAEGRAARVRLLAGGEVVADCIAGDERANPRAQFVRLAAEPQTFRVLGSIAVDTDTRRWVDAELLSLPEGEVDSVLINGLEVKATVGADGRKSYAATEAGALVTAGEFEWADLRKAAAVRSLPGWLARLELEDVRKATGGAADPAISPIFDMVRGTLKVNAVRDGDAVWISFEATPREGAPSAEEVNAKRKHAGDPFVPDWAEFARKHAGWEYKLPGWKVTALEESLTTPATRGDPNQPVRIQSARD